MNESVPNTQSQNPSTCNLQPATSTPPSPAVYSIFTGRKPYLDEYLAEQGRLMFVDTIEKVGLIRIERRVGVGGSGGVGVSGSGSVGVETFVPRNPQLAAQVTDQLISLAGA